MFESTSANTDREMEHCMLSTLPPKKHTEAYYTPKKLTYLYINLHPNHFARYLTLHAIERNTQVCHRSVPNTNSHNIREVFIKQNESMEFVQKGGRGQTPNPNFFVLVLLR